MNKKIVISLISIAFSFFGICFVDASCSLRDLKGCDKQGLINILMDIIKTKKDSEVKVKFKATEVVLNNLPESIEFWTEANCPGNGEEYEYEIPDDFIVDSCFSGAVGSHGGCKTCEMSRVLLNAVKEIYIPLEKLSNDDEIIKFFRERKVIDSYCIRSECKDFKFGDTNGSNGIYSSGEISRHIYDYSLNRKYTVIVGACRSKACQAVVFLVDEDTGLIMPPQYGPITCNTSFDAPIFLNKNKVPFFKIGCSYWPDEYSSSIGTQLIFIDNKKLRRLREISGYYWEGKGGSEFGDAIETRNRFIDLDGDGNKEVVELGQSYTKTEKGRINQKNIVDIYKWNESAKSFEHLPKANGLYLNSNLYGVYFGACTVDIALKNIRAGGIKILESMSEDDVGTIVLDEELCRKVESGYSLFGDKCVPYDVCEKTGVISGSPADKIGIVSGDIILDFDGEKIETDKIDGILDKYNVGDLVKVKILRDGEIKEIKVKLEQRPLDL